MIKEVTDQIKNLHVFFADNEHYIKKVIEYCKDARSSNCFVNIANSDTRLDGVDFFHRKDFKRAAEHIISIDFDSVIFHPFAVDFGPFLLRKIKRARPDASIKWVCWSGELYSFDFQHTQFLEQNSQRYVNRGLLNILMTKATYWKKYILGQPRLHFATFAKGVRQVDEFCHTFQSDHRHLESMLNRKIKNRFVSYQDTKGFQLDFAPGESGVIFIGHSASPYNNHFEVLDKLEPFDSIVSVVIGLGYGDGEYKRAIVNRAKSSVHASRMTILDKMLTIVEYENVLRSASVVIINSYCQKGVGNLVRLLHNGKKVVLSKKNPLYEEFVSMGLHIENLDDLTDDLIDPLSDEKMKHNRQIIETFFNAEKVDSNWLELLDGHQL